MQIEIRNTTFELLPEKALWRNDTRQLVIADIHLGKATHFRKAGISFPDGAAKDDIVILKQLFEKLQPSTVILLGDLFHSVHNREWDLIEELFSCCPEIKFILVKGNHDIFKLPGKAIDNFTIVNTLEDEHFIYSHKPIAADKFVICGHIHPAISITDQLHHSIRLPCFYLSAEQLILPAFGKLTGLQTVKRKNLIDKYFVIYNSNIALV
jgi:uncharacterized protein